VSFVHEGAQKVPPTSSAVHRWATPSIGAQSRSLRHDEQYARLTHTFTTSPMRRRFALATSGVVFCAWHPKPAPQSSSVSQS
jgi:hypothetical protein